MLLQSSFGPVLIVGSMCVVIVVDWCAAAAAACCCVAAAAVPMPLYLWCGGHGVVCCLLHHCWHCKVQLTLSLRSGVPDQAVCGSHGFPQYPCTCALNLEPAAAVRARQCDSRLLQCILVATMCTEVDIFRAAVAYADVWVGQTPTVFRKC
jgi:hypothetical protein